MKIDQQTLLTLEKLAKLTVDDGERELTAKKITQVLERLDKIDFNEIIDLEPLSHPLEIHQTLRSDVADADIQRAALQGNAPQVAQGLFLVPKVIE